MRRTSLAGAAALVVVASIAGAGEEASPMTAEAFAVGLEQVRSTLERRRPDEAREQLAVLLETHRERPWAYGKRLEIERLFLEAAFAADYGSPSPKEFVSGTLERYIDIGGTLEIAYASDALQDLLVVPSPLARKEKDALPTEPTSEDELLHPATFKGPVRIEVSGEKWRTVSKPNAPSEVVFARRRDGSAHEVRFHAMKKKGVRATRVVVERRDGFERTKLGSAEVPWLVPGEPYVVVVDVKPSSVRVTANGKKALSARLSGDVSGMVSIRVPGFARLEFAGQIEPQWMQSLADRHRAAAWETFEASYVGEQVVPEWLRAERSPGPEAVTAAQHGHEPFAAELLAALDADDDAGARAVLLRASETDAVTLAGREYLRARYEQRAGDAQKAVRHCSVANEADPAREDFWLLRFELVHALRHEAEVLEAFAAAALEFPRLAELHTAGALCLLRGGRADLARAVLERAAAEGLRSESIERVHALLVKAESGPAWPRVHEHETEHYRVRSDLDPRTCRDAANTLEQAFTWYRRELCPVDTDRKFQVFVFSGQAGYEAYLKDLEIETPVHSAGLYSSTLKQLLIWNLPDRDHMMRTVRHEGFHQYLDLVSDSIPRWLNEGLAEYFEVATVGAIRSTGQVHDDHLGTLGLLTVPVSWTLSASPARFYALAPIGYAHAWATVHYLRHGGREPQALFEEIVALLPLRDGRRITEAVERYGVDRLELEVREYLQALIAERRGED